MVTKHISEHVVGQFRSVLAKIHMVTKLLKFTHLGWISSVLAKIHMVTKPQKHAITFLN